jgi:hypothetical protein
LVDTVADLLVPPLSVLASAAGTSAALSWLIDAVRPSRFSRLGSRVSGATCVVITVHIFSGLLLAGAPRAVYVGLLRAPQMMAWKVMLWGRMLIRPGHVSWIRTARIADDALGSP